MSAADLCNRRLAGAFQSNGQDDALEVVRLKAALVRIATARWRNETPLERVQDLQHMATEALDAHLERLNRRKS